MKSTLLALAIGSTLVCSIAHADSAASSSTTANAQVDASMSSGDARAEGSLSLDQGIQLNDSNFTQQSSASGNTGLDVTLPSPPSKPLSARSEPGDAAEQARDKAAATRGRVETTAAGAVSTGHSAAMAGQARANEAAASAAERLNATGKSLRDQSAATAQQTMRQRIHGEISADISQRARADIRSSLRDGLGQPTSALGL